MDEELVTLLRGQISRGEVVLFTGAGFSTSAKNAAGDHLPVGSQLARKLWDIAFAHLPFDDRSPLTDIFECAVQTARARTGQILRDNLHVPTEGVPEVYRVWFSMPWFRIYTLNVDDLLDAVQSAYTLPQRIRAVSALTEATPGRTDELLCVHLNGRLQDYPDVTFATSQYGRRLALPEPWYETLTADIASHPVVFVGTPLDEPSLWQHIALRELRSKGIRERRPRSYLVTRDLPEPRRQILQQYNVEFVAGTADDFALGVLQEMPLEAETGRQAAAALRGGTAAVDRPLHSVGELRQDRADDLREYLLGREPRWADVTDGYAVEREHLSSIEQLSLTPGRVTFVTGTGGSGKTTTLMQLAVRLHSEGQDVVWLDSSTEWPLTRLRSAVEDRAPQFVIIDQVDRFGYNGGRLIRDLISSVERLHVVASLRRTRLDRLDYAVQLGDIGHAIVDVPPLQDADIEGLIDALEAANRLGALRGLNRDQQRDVFKRSAQRQLLVALIEATSGERFEDYIHSEFRELDAGPSLVYGMLSLVTMHGYHMTREEVLVAVGAGTMANEVLEYLNSLVRQHLVVGHREDQYRVRHRVIADRVWRVVREEQDPAEIAEGVLFAMATRRREGAPRHAREQRLLELVLNHRFMREEIRDLARIRSIYDGLEDVLTHDFHYWLQRGSLEVEVGDLRRAENFLAQAKGLAPTNEYVLTEWSYMQLKRAAQDAEAGRPGHLERADVAITDLLSTIDRVGSRDSYPYHVLGSQGLSWTRRAMLPLQERRRRLSELFHAVQEGVAHHPRARDLRQLEEDIRREYLETTLPQREQGTRESS